MKHGRRAAVLCTAALALILLLAEALYLKQQGGSSPMQKPGTLTGVMYGYSGGMTVRNDFFIWLSPEAIVETFYYPEEPRRAWAGMIDSKKRMSPSLPSSGPMWSRSSWSFTR